MKRYSLFVILLISPVLFAELPNAYVSPADGIEYTAEWEEHEPDNPNYKDGVIVNGPLRLLNQTSKFEENVTINGFSDFCLLIQDEVEKVIVEWSDKSQLLVQVTIHPDVKPEFVIAYQGDVSKDSLQALYDAFTSQLDYRTLHDDLKFEKSFSIDKSSE